MRDPQAIACAIHEAGHAIASLCVGVPIQYVELTDDGGGWCVNQMPRIRTIPHEAKIIIHMAGGIAEAIYRGHWDRHTMLQFVEDHCGATTDLQRADAVGIQLSRVAGVYVPQHLVDRTMALLLDNWAAVQAVATALVQERWIDGDRVREILTIS